MSGNVNHATPRFFDILRTRPANTVVHTVGWGAIIECRDTGQLIGLRWDGSTTANDPLHCFN